MATPDVRPVGDLPNELGKTAPRELPVGWYRQCGERERAL